MSSRVWIVSSVLAALCLPGCDEQPGRAADGAGLAEAGSTAADGSAPAEEAGPAPDDAAPASDDGVAPGDGPGVVDAVAPTDALAADGSQGDGAVAGGRNLAGSHTQRVATPCTLTLGPAALDQAKQAKPGDVVCFQAGSYKTLKLVGLKGSASQPIVFRTVAGAERQATFSSGAVGSGYGISLESAEHVHLYDLRVAKSQKGIDVWSSSYCRIEGLLLEELGQEGIHVGRPRTYDGSNKFIGPESHHVDVIGNEVRRTGQVTAKYGEGIYIGTGAFGGDETHDVFVAYNRLDKITAEAVELKPYTYNLTARGNLITDSSHEYNGAITVAVEPASFRDGNYLIEDNRIYDYRSTQWSIGGIVIGHGNAVIRHNVIWGIDGGRGIRIYTTFANQAARKVEIYNNTVWNPGSSQSILLDNGDAGSGVKDKLADNVVADNVTDDGSAGSTKLQASAFVGPLSGLADAGQGPGSGFAQQSYQGVGADLTRIVP